MTEIVEISAAYRFLVHYAVGLLSYDHPPNVPPNGKIPTAWLGSPRLAFMMLDADVVAASRALVHRHRVPQHRRLVRLLSAHPGWLQPVHRAPRTAGDNAGVPGRIHPPASTREAWPISDTGTPVA